MFWYDDDEDMHARTHKQSSCLNCAWSIILLWTYANDGSEQKLNYMYECWAYCYSPNDTHTAHCSSENYLHSFLWWTNGKVNKATVFVNTQQYIFDVIMLHYTSIRWAEILLVFVYNRKTFIMKKQTFGAHRSVPNELGLANERTNDWMNIQNAISWIWGIFNKVHPFAGIKFNKKKIGNVNSAHSPFTHTPPNAFYWNIYCSVAYIL